MGVIVTGHNSPTGFQNSEAVTVSNLNSHVNDSSFDTTAVDNSSIELTNNDQQLRLKDSTSTTTGTTLGKLQYIGSGKVLGRASANDGIVEQLTLDTDLATVSASHNELASSKAIKDYIDSQINSKILGIGQSFTTVTRVMDDSTTYDNDTGRPIYLRFLAFYANVSNNDDISVDIGFKTTGSSDAFGYHRLCDEVGFSGYASTIGEIIIPNGLTYKLRNNNGDNVPQSVAIELR